MTDALPTPPAMPAPLQIGIAAQYIKDFSFESPQVPQIFMVSMAQPQLQMGVNIQTRSTGEDQYEVLLSMKLEALIDGKVGFIAELTYGGIFMVPAMPPDQLKLFLLVEAPRSLFPFARSIMATAIREGGFPAVMIQPIDFVALYLANKDNVGTMAAAGAA